ncbi:hypothetical protein TNCV_2578921 [Trichonephila clavipes]|nr:hypothetical protein TNCV_2578921 [Trichonephila clavipes]
MLLRVSRLEVHLNDGSLVMAGHGSRVVKPRLNDKDDTRCGTSFSKLPHHVIWRTLSLTDIAYNYLSGGSSVPSEGCGSPVVKVSDHGRHVMSLSPVPLKTHRVGQLCTLNLSRAETSSRWCGS